jgi:hypothetical protein
MVRVKSYVVDEEDGLRSVFTLSMNVKTSVCSLEDNEVISD